MSVFLRVRHGQTPEYRSLPTPPGRYQPVARAREPRRLGDIGRFDPVVISRESHLPVHRLDAGMFHGSRFLVALLSASWYNSHP